MFLSHSGSDFALVEHLARVMACDNLAELWALHKDCMAGYGFDSLFYAYSYQMSERDFGALNDAVMLSSFPADYMQAFINRNLLVHCPMWHWSLENTGAISWEHFQEVAPATEREAEIMALAESHELTKGYLISFRDFSTRSKGVIAMANRGDISQAALDEVWAQHGSAIEVINWITHKQITAMPALGVNQPLTPRQIEVLEWVGAGKTAQDIATILSVAPATVEKHLRLAREALQVETTAHAVLKATLQNQIYRVQNG